MIVTRQWPLSCDTGKDQDGQEDEGVDVDLTFSGLDDNSLVEKVRDITQLNSLLITTKF